MIVTSRTFCFRSAITMAGRVGGNIFELGEGLRWGGLGACVQFPHVLLLKHLLKNLPKLSKTFTFKKLWGKFVGKNSGGI